MRDPAGRMAALHNCSRPRCAAAHRVKSLSTASLQSATRCRHISNQVARLVVSVGCSRAGLQC